MSQNRRDFIERVTAGAMLATVPLSGDAIRALATTARCQVPAARRIGIALRAGFETSMDGGEPRCLTHQTRTRRAEPDACFLGIWPLVAGRWHLAADTYFVHGGFTPTDRA